MLQNTGNCVGFISEIWEIKPPLCTSLNPLIKKTKPKQNQVFTQSPSLGSITATHKLSKPKQKKNQNKTSSKDLFKDKVDFFFNLVNAKTFWAQLIWGVRCSNNVNFQWGC